MKAGKILTTVFLFLAMLAMGQNKLQDSLLQHYFKYPQEAIDAAEKMYRQAVKTQDTPLLLKALIQKTAFSIRMNQDEYPQMLKELEEYIKKEKDPIAKCILHSYTGQLYSQYYNQNRYTILQRTPLEGYLPENPEEWSENIFQERILQHLTASLSSQTLLQETAVNRYEDIIITGEASDSLRPTLYDFLSHRVVNLLSHLSFPEQNTAPSNPALLASVTEFLAFRLKADSLSISYHILKTWQDLLRFRLHQNNMAALVVADLERLDYTRRNVQLLHTDSLYLTTLQKMRQQYADEAIVVEIIAKEANALLRTPSTPSLLHIISETPVTLQRRQEALALCEQGIRQYPHYNRINLLHDIIENIKAPFLNAEFPRMIYPQDSLTIKITSRNFTEITVEIYRIQSGTVTYWNAKNKNKIPKNKIYEQKIRLTEGLQQQDTTLQISIPRTGLYQISLNSPGSKKAVSAETICSRLFITDRTTPDGQIFRVCDWKSGMPIQGAKILRYTAYSPYALIDTLLTNAQGIANGKVSAKARTYQVINAENPNGYLSSSIPYYPDNMTEKNTTLITDRHIYRPGQVVYYQGIAWHSTPDTLYPVVDQSFTISFRNPNYKEIASEKKKSNTFGSFAGSFVIPPQTLNGTYVLTTENSQADILVTDYKRPEFEIDFSDPVRHYYIGDRIEVQGQVRSFSGVKLPNTAYEYRISLYSPLFWYPEMEKVVKGSGQTNANGEFSLAFQADVPPIDRPFRRNYFYRIEVKVTDSKGESQEAGIDIPVYSGMPQPVVHIPAYVDKNRPETFRISLEDLDPEKTTQTVQYVLSKLRLPHQLTSEPEVRDTIVEKAVLTGEVRINQKDSLLLPLEKFTSGAYLFSVKCGEKKADRIFYLYANSDKRPPIPTYSWLPQKQFTCRPGESIEIPFGTSAQSAYVIYELFAPDKLLERCFLTLNDTITKINIPYKSIYGRKLQLTISYVKDRYYIQETVEIQRKEANQQLTVHTKTFRDNLQPGQQESWEIRVTDSQNRPVQAEVLAMMYDASLDKISPYQIRFTPTYAYTRFPGFWSEPSASTRNNYLTLSPWSFKRPNYPVPPFRFDALQTFQVPEVSDVMELGMEDQVVAAGLYSRARKTLQSKASNDLQTVTFGQQAISTDQVNDAGVPTIKLRQNFQETAFFYPQLQTTPNGDLLLKFTAPESTTQWKFTALAYTRQLVSGEFTRYITTSKLLMIRPNLPRFFRSGDITEIQVTISNLSDSLQEGTAQLELFLPGCTENILLQNTNFRVNAGGSQTVRFRFQVPSNIDLAGCRITAQSEMFSDGEQHLIPILPAEILVTKTLPFYLQESGTQTFTLQQPVPIQQAYRLTLELTANPIWYAVLALPSLQIPETENTIDVAAAYYVNTLAHRIATANPKLREVIQSWAASAQDSSTLLSKLEQNSELKSILLEASPWVMQAQSETERMQMLSQLFDPNRVEYLQQQALQKLAGLQTGSGSWSWFKGMYPSRFQTIYVLTLLARANSTGQHEYSQREKEMQIKALHYLDQEIQKDYKNTPEQISYDQILYLNVRSLYRDIPLGDALQAHKYFLSLAEKQWENFSLYEKALIAMSLWRYGLQTEARAILKSLHQYAQTTSEMGMFWPNNRNVDYRNSSVQVHTTLMEAFHEIEGNSQDINAMKQWLLRQKQTQSWASVPATVDAVHALLLTGSDQLNQKENLDVRLGSYTFSTSSSNPLGYLKKSFSHEEIKSNMSTVKISKNEHTPSWGGMYLQYFERLDQVKRQSSALQVDKKLFIEKSDSQGNTRLFPLENESLKTGNKVIVRLTLSLDRDMEFLYLQDLRATCFEPVEQLSRNHWKFGTVYYQETKDAATNFFFNSLSRGTYVLEYAVWVNQVGAYQDGIATFQSFYAPEFNAHSQAEKIKVAE